MYIRFINIVNELKLLGNKEFIIKDFMRKILGFMFLFWEKKVIVIQEVKQMNEFLLDELIDNLGIY